MSDIKVTFNYENKVLRDPLLLGSFEADETSQEFDIFIKHNSNKAIRNSGFFVSPYTGIYDGSNSSLKDYKKIIWYGDNYEGYGLSIKQNYTIYGEIFRQESGRLIDLSREEENNFFTGHEIEILSGPITGERQTITGYDPSNSMFLLANDFSLNVDGERYRIDMETINFIKSNNGTSEQNAIPLLFNGGKIDRFAEAKITLKIKIPPYMKEVGINHINFNMSYTPEDIE